MSVNKSSRTSRISAVIALSVASCGLQFGATESSIHGQVTNLRGKPIDKVMVQFYKLESRKQVGEESLLAETITDETGYYIANGLEWGYYRIHFEKPHWEAQDIWGFFVANGSRHLLNVALPGGMPAHLGTESRVRGVVKDEASTQIAGATVVIVPVHGPNQYRQTHTKESGEFSYFIENGSYLIYATAPGAVSEPIFFKTRGRKERTFVLQLMPDS